MKLSAKARFGFDGEPFLALLGKKSPDGSFGIREISKTASAGSRLKATDEKAEPSGTEVLLPADLDYLGEGDILRLNPRSGDVRALYRSTSNHNTLFFTERCNSRCLMCSQPPRNVNDGYLVEDILTAIPWMAKDTPELGITGGEPTLLGDKLIEVIGSAKANLPKTALHMLSNGRLFAYAQLAQKVANVGHPDFMIGIPLYSDIAQKHDFVVQAKGAFEQTIMGILNLARVGVRIEIRMVIHRETYARLPEFANFVARNLPFVDQVVLMGLEPTGFARSNFEALWIDPADYQNELEKCISTLKGAGVRTSVYNHQLCVLSQPARPFAQRSISDWKNVYLPECDPCVRKAECGGFFESASARHSSRIKPFTM